MQAALLKLLTDRAVCAVDEARECLQHPDMAGLPKDKQHQVLAARGLLACGLLPHCLQSRHRVDFGVNRCGLQVAERYTCCQYFPDT